MSATRADKLLADRQLVASRTQAQRLISEGKVRYRLQGSRLQGSQLQGDWVAVTKASDKIPDNATLDVMFDANDRFVSRGGLKLAHALASQHIDVVGRIALDVGQSTGGFTDCLLQAGCRKVIGVDVGHDQLDATLRSDARVTCLEGVNARELDVAQLLALCGADLPVSDQPGAGGFDIIVMDVSFISQTKILPVLKPLLQPQGWLVTLVKPQFELSRSQLGKGGIVRDGALFQQVKDTVIACATESGFVMTAWMDSPIVGGDGNHEFLLVAQHSGISG
jgi:23S rRNA (cytidine1920-2'-O)/16S rRNA (cytidine1409-2'-O)-methyltransferase